LGILDSLVRSRSSQAETADRRWARRHRREAGEIAELQASAYRRREAAQTDTEVLPPATTVLPPVTTSTPVAVDPITVAAKVDLALGGCAAQIGDGSYAMEIIGEAQYQSEIEFVAGPRTTDPAQCFSVALLMPEPTNLRDPNEVSVRLRTGMVGYLRRDMAPVFVRSLRQGGFAMAVSRAVKRVSQGGVAYAKNDVMLYSFVEAETHEAAAKAFEDHPHLQIPEATIEIMEVRPMGPM
jgi:hypothetical protein